MNDIVHFIDFMKDENESITYIAEINYLPNFGLPLEVFSCNDLKKLKSFAKSISKLSCISHVIIKYYESDVKIIGY